MEYNDRQKLKTGHHGRQRERPESHTAPALGARPPPGHPNMESSGHKWVCHPAEPWRGRPQTANTFLTMARYMARESRMPSRQGTGEPTRPREKDGMGAALVPGPPASVCVVASRLCHSLICHGLWPCDSAAFLLWGQKFGADQGKGTGWQRGAVVGQCTPVKASGQGVSCTQGTFGAGMWGRMCVSPCWLKTVPSPLDKHAQGRGRGPRSLTVPPFLDASGEAEQHRRDRRTRTHPVSAGSPSTR